MFEALESRHLLSADAGWGDANLAYGGIADSSLSSTNAGLIVAIDTSAGIVAPLQQNLSGDGIGVSGVAFTGDARLWMARNDAIGSLSVLQEIDPGRGTALGTPINLQLRVFDLATNPLDGSIYAIGQSGGAIASQTSLYRIDLNTGGATLAGHLDADNAFTLAIDASGKGFVTAFDRDSGAAVLIQIALPDASTQRTMRLQPSAELASVFSGELSGLGIRADGQLVGSDASTGTLMRVDSLTGAMQAIATQAPVHGVLGDLAFSGGMTDLCAIDQVYREDFNSNDGQFTIDNTGRTINGLWHRTAGRRFDHLLNHSPNNAFYYGGFETAFGGGNYVLTQSHMGTITSPKIALPDSGTTIVSFSYLLDTRPELSTDFVSVGIIVDGVKTQILSRQDGTLPETTIRQWLSATHDISSFNGQTIQIEFLFDTGPVPQVDPEGWYVDDIEIINIPAPRISGYKWNDLNADGHWQADEPGLNGRTIYLDLNDNGLLDAGESSFITRNDGTHDGAYWFNCPPDGEYLVREMIPEGWLQTFPLADDGTADAHRVTLVGDQIAAGEFGEAQGMNFGNSHIDVRGYKWNDLNDNGLWDTGEPALGDWTIYVDANDNGNLDPGERSTRTSATGSDAGAYVFAGLGDGEHVIREQINTLWRQTFPAAPANSQNDSVAHVVTIDSANAIYAIAVAGVAAAPNFGNHLIRPADLSISKQASASEVSAGDFVVYTITAENIAQPGSDVAKSVQVVDALPAGLSLVGSPRALLGDVTTHVDPSTGRITVTWDSFDLAAGEAASLTFAVQVASDVGSTILTNIVTGTHSGDELDPSNNDGSNAAAQSAIDVAAVVQFTMPIDVTRKGPATYIAPPTTDGPTISGYKWADLNRDAVWDVGEPALAGYVLYLDLDNDGHQDFDETTDNDLDGKLDVAEPVAITDDQGQFVFTSLADGSPLSDGDYTIRQATLVSAGTVTVQTFPIQQVDQPGASLVPGGQLVTITDGESLAGGFEQTASPNFGGYAYVHFIRPADDLAGHLDAWAANPTLAQASLGRSLGEALAVWQTISMTNTTGSDLVVEGIDLDALSDDIEKYITLRTVDGASDIPFDFNTGRLLVPHTIPGVDDPATERDETRWELAVYFNPAWHDSAAVDQAIDAGIQSPDWRNTTVTSTVDFSADDTLVFTTDTASRFRVKLFGGSTFDSDISYSGAVNFEDVLTLQGMLSSSPVIATDPRFDFTKDINVRYPNGADGDIHSRYWPIQDIVGREIGLGDYGPLNLQIGYVRPAWIDLDADNSGGKLGTGNQAVLSGTSDHVNIADADAVIGADDNLTIESMSIRLAGETNDSDSLALPGQSGQTQWTFNDIRVYQATDILRQMTFTSDDRSQFRSVDIVVEIVIANTSTQKTPLASVASRTSSAITRMLIAPSV